MEVEAFVEDIAEAEVVEEPEEETPIRRRRRRRKKRRPSIAYDDADPGGLSIGYLDGLFSDTYFVFLILLCVCCTPVAVILGVLGLIFTSDSDARRNALTVTLVSVLWTFVAACFGAATKLR